MLIISRRVDEAVVVTTDTGQRIVIMVTDVVCDRPGSREDGRARARIKLGIDAPQTMSIHREPS